MRRDPVLLHGVLSLLLAALLASGLWLWLSGSWTWLPWLGAWLAAINLTTLLWFGLDKRQARREGRRVPEVVLHSLALVGGSVGACAGMRLFRHKTLKGRFRLVFGLIVLLQAGLAAWLAVRLRTRA